MPFHDIRLWVNRVPFSMSTAASSDGPMGGISAPVEASPPVVVGTVDESGGEPGLGAADMALVDSGDVAGLAVPDIGAAPPAAEEASVAKGKGGKGGKKGKKGNGGKGGRGGKAIKEVKTSKGGKTANAGTMKKPACAAAVDGEEDSVDDDDAPTGVTKKPAGKHQAAPKGGKKAKVAPSQAAPCASGGGDLGESGHQAQDTQLGGSLVAVAPDLMEALASTTRDSMKARRFNSLFLNRQLPPEALALIDEANADKAKGDTPLVLCNGMPGTPTGRLCASVCVCASGGGSEYI